MANSDCPDVQSLTNDEIEQRSISIIEKFNKRRSAALKQKRENAKSESPTEDNDKLSKMDFNDNQTGCKSAVSRTEGNSASQETVDLDFQNTPTNENTMGSNSTYGLDSFLSTRLELDELLDSSDSDDLICNISLKKHQNTCYADEIDENYFNFSTQLQQSPEMVFKDLSLWEKQQIPALQIGAAIPTPIFCIEEAKFSNHVFQILKDIKFFGPSCIQSLVWPSVDRGRSLFAVAPPHSGKTVSYVLPLVSRLTSGKMAENKETGPVSIILCSSWPKVQAVRDYFHLFLGHSKKKIVTLCTEGGNMQNRIAFLINQCDILIATPYCLFNFFQKKLIKLTRLEELVLDDGSAIMDKHKSELKEILLYLMEARNTGACSPELMVFAERWDKNFEIVINKVMSTPLIYFTSFLEAAVYAKVPISAHICSTNGEKKMALISMVKKSGKIVICTTNGTDALDIHHFLKRFHIKSYVINEEMEHYQTTEVMKSWKSGGSNSLSPCLIISDQCLAKMCISDASCLIHYDIPPKSRLQFGNRFSCIAEYFTEEAKGYKCASHVLVMESEYCFTPHLVEIIENSGGTPSEQLVEISKMQRKEDNSSGDFCHYMKAFGFCKNSNCIYRHIIDPQMDMPQVVPCEGDIHGLVTHVIDASHYYVRLLKYLDPTSNKTVSLTVAHASLGFQLREFYKTASQDMKVEVPEVGKSYVLAGENKLFYRVKILEYLPETSTETAQWKILYLDEGWIKSHNVLNIYKLTEQLELPEPLAVEVYACNIKTPDSCFDWNPQTSLLVSDLIKGKEIHGKITLCIGKTLLLDPLALAVQLPNGIYAYPFKVNQKLLDFGHALQNKKHLKLLHKACDGKIPFPKLTKPELKKSSSNEQKTPVNYAFLECNVNEDVYVSSVVSPNQLYVQRAKFVKCLDDLLEKINEMVDNKKIKRAFNLYKDMLCIAPFHEDNRYYRAKVIEFASCDEVFLFYVDFGDTGKALLKNLYILPPEYLLLPFQAIECELAGIAAPHGGWCESAVNKLTALTRDDAYDMKIVLLKAYQKTNNCYTGGNHYIVDLWDDGKRISELLLQDGFGVQADMPIQSSPISPPDNTQDPSINDQTMSVDEHLTLPDDDLDSDDKEIAEQFYIALAQKFYDDLYPEQPTITEVSSDGEGISNDCKATQSVPTVENENLKQPMPNLRECKKFKPATEESPRSHKPLITWWDTPEQLHILINLKDVKLYQLDLTDEGLKFSTIIAGVEYETEEKFYQKIKSEDAKTWQSAQGINISAMKYTHFKWKRFNSEKIRVFHIKYDMDHLNDIDDLDNEEPLVDKELEKLKYQYEDIDNNESSTDEDEKHVTPWQDLAETSDIYRELA